MEAYQPLNTYSFCQTRGQQNNISHHVKKFKLLKSVFTKYILSLIAVIFVVATVLLVKIDAREPISLVPAQNESAIVVGSGDTLWRIASTHYADIKDVGFAVYLIKDRNGLDNSAIYPGQTIILPNIK